MTPEEKVSLRRSYVEDYHRRTGEYIKTTTCSPWEVMASFTTKVSYWKIVEIVCDFTGWDSDTLFRTGQNEEKVFRRSIVDFIAVHNGCTCNMCARITQRDHTTVMRSLKGLENRLTNDTYTRVFFKEITDYVRENFHIYENENITSS